MALVKIPKANTVGMNDMFRLLNPLPTATAAPTGTVAPPGTPNYNAPGGVPAPAPTPIDYKQLIGQDEIWQQLQKQLGAEGIENTTNRNTSLTQGIARSGYDLNMADVFKQLGLDPNSEAGRSVQGVYDQARPLAQANTAAGLSAKARLDQANKQSIRDLMDAVGATGMARSGYTGKGLKERDLQYRQQNYDTINSLLDYMQGAQQAYIQAERARQGQYNTGLGEATNRAYTNADALGMGASTKPVTNGNPQMGGGEDWRDTVSSPTVQKSGYSPGLSVDQIANLYSPNIGTDPLIAQYQKMFGL